MKTVSVEDLEAWGEYSTEPAEQATYLCALAVCERLERLARAMERLAPAEIPNEPPEGEAWVPVKEDRT